VTVQVDEQLAVRVAVSQQVGGMYGQGGLPDAGHPIDRGDHHGLRGLVLDGQPVQEFAQLPVAPGEIRCIAGQVAARTPAASHPCRHREGPARFSGNAVIRRAQVPGRRHAQVTRSTGHTVGAGRSGKDSMVEVLQVPGGVDAELLTQQTSHLVVGIKRIGVAPRGG